MWSERGGGKSESGVFTLWFAVEGGFWHFRLLGKGDVEYESRGSETYAVYVFVLVSILK